jgi:hypothetical protein
MTRKFPEKIPCSWMEAACVIRVASGTTTIVNKGVVVFECILTLALGLRHILYSDTILIRQSQYLQLSRGKFVKARCFNTF